MVGLRWAHRHTDTWGLLWAFGGLSWSPGAGNQQLRNWLQRKDSHPAGVSFALKKLHFYWLFKLNHPLLHLTPPLLFPGTFPGSESHKPQAHSASLENVAAGFSRSNALYYSCVEQWLDQLDGTLPRNTQGIPNLLRSHASMISQKLK